MMRKSFALPFRLIACGMILSAGLAASAEPSSPSPYRITGVVLNSITGNPIARCHLEISLTGRNQGPMRRASAGNGFDADEHGRFSIPVTSAGAWRLTASAPGYVTQAFNEHNNYSSAIVLSASAPTYDLQFRLPPQGRISGSVLDEAGESVRNANVQLMTEVPPTPDHRVASFVPRFLRRPTTAASMSSPACHLAAIASLSMRGHGMQAQSASAAARRVHPLIPLSTSHIHSPGIRGAAILRWPRP